jgi:hypothetical protein
MPDRKISETFLQFAEPLLETMGPQATQGQMEQLLQLTFTVWNAVVYADATANPQFLDYLRKVTGNDPLIAGLITRKRELFGDDHRLIGEYKLTRKAGQLHLWAEARNPFTPA